MRIEFTDADLEIARRGRMSQDDSREFMIEYRGAMAEDLLREYRQTGALSLRWMYWLLMRTTGSESVEAMCEQLIAKHKAVLVTRRLEGEA